MQLRVAQGGQPTPQKIQPLDINDLPKIGKVHPKVNELNTDYQTLDQISDPSLDGRDNESRHKKSESGGP